MSSTNYMRELSEATRDIRVFLKDAEENRALGLSDPIREDLECLSLEIRLEALRMLHNWK